VTQRDRVLLALKAAGPKGVRSDTFIKNFMPRAAARVQELKDDGHDISSEREGKYVRWTLNVGVESERVSGGSHPSARPERPIGGRAAGSKAPGPSGRTSQQKATLDSGVAEPNVGSSTEGRDQAGNSIPQPVDAALGVASGVAASPLLPVPVEARARTIPSAYDCWEDAA
jgi:hypothetical protein